MEIRLFSITSNEFEGVIVAGFNDENDDFASIDLSNAILSKKQHAWFLENMPKSIGVLNQWIKERRKLKIEEEKITFEMFWDRYDEKQNSSKKKTLAKWNKMSIVEQGKAYRFIGRYLTSLGHGNNAGKKYATTYLNDELWNN